VGGLAVHHQGVVDLAALDHAAGDVHAVDEGQAGVGDVEVLAFVAKAEVAADDAGRGRLEVVAADRGIDQQAHARRVDAGIGQRLDAGQGGGVGGQNIAVPEAAGVDVGNLAQHIGTDVQAVERRLQ